MPIRCFIAVACLFTAVIISNAAELVRAEKIWNEGNHNAFTDLIRFGDRWICVFREGKGHVSPDGAIRIIQSSDGKTWSSLALITSDKADLRDPKMVVMPNGELMLHAAGAYAEPQKRHQSLAWFSKDGKEWGEAVEIGEPNIWIWRIVWDKSSAYAIGYDTKGEEFTRLYKSDNGRDFKPIVSKLNAGNYPNETGLVFLEDGSMACLLRRDGAEASGKFGIAPPPFTKWEWKDVGPKIGGPTLIQLPDGRLIGAVRLYDGGARTAVIEIDRKSGKLSELVKLPSGGDCSYPGLVWHENSLWVSYYSSHQGKTEIYFAEVKLN
ncbi:MAG: sialidase family protein [Verrucomicrobiales bacterium]